MKELLSPYKECPFCHKDVSEYIESTKNVLKSLDIHMIEDDAGIYTQWKEVYKCPHCKRKFYTINEH